MNDGQFRKRGRRCGAPDCENELAGTPRQQFCSRTCKQRAAYARRADHFRALQATWRETHREEAIETTRQWRLANPGGANRAERQHAEERRVQRQVDRPNCVICSTRLTDKQRARGVTCSPYHATLRWRWFVREAA